MEKIGLLTGYINSAVPYAWDNSESWYEFLAKMLSKVNEVVEATNAYFGVDIESFVTEKLIEWENDGTLQALISENNKKIKDGFVNVTEYGAVGDYILPDGTVNPNPTDNAVALQNAFNASTKIKFADGHYYSSQPILMQKSTTVLGNSCTVVFEGDGFNMGDDIWNSPEFYDLNITKASYNTLPPYTGKGIFSNECYIVYPVLHNVEIYGFGYAIYSQAGTSDSSNLTWGKIERVRIEYCEYGLYLLGGWCNTVKFSDLYLNYISKSAVHIEVQQGHNIAFDALTMESDSRDPAQYGTFVVANTQIGQITINGLYGEGNGTMRTATLEEVTNFTTNGTLIIGKYYESKSYLLNGEVYSQDTGSITPEVITNNGLFRLHNCASMQLRINNGYFTTNYAPIVNFNGCGTSVNVYIDKFYLHNQGYSFPNVRSAFVNKTPASIPSVTMENITSDGGGTNIDCQPDIINVNGDTFGGGLIGSKKDIFSYGMLQIVSNLALPATTETVVPLTNKQGDMSYSLSGGQFTVTRAGVYQLSASLVFTHNSTEPIDVVFYQGEANKFGNSYNIKSGKPISLTGLMYLNANSTIELRVKNNDVTDNNLLGVNGGVCYVLIKKIN